MIFSVYYNYPNDPVANRIDSYDITEPELYIPKLLLLKMADLCKKKGNWELKIDEKFVLDFLIEGFKHIGILNPDIDESYIWETINSYLLLADVNTMTELYEKMTKPDNSGYAVFTILEEVD
jgi:hypothetical protein